MHPIPIYPTVVILDICYFEFRNHQSLLFSRISVRQYELNLNRRNKKSNICCTHKNWHQRTSFLCLFSICTLNLSLVLDNGIIRIFEQLNQYFLQFSRARIEDVTRNPGSTQYASTTLRAEATQVHAPKHTDSNNTDKVLKNLIAKIQTDLLKYIVKETIYWI